MFIFVKSFGMRLQTARCGAFFFSAIFVWLQHRTTNNWNFLTWELIQTGQCAFFCFLVEIVDLKKNGINIKMYKLKKLWTCAIQHLCIYSENQKNSIYHLWLLLVLIVFFLYHIGSLALDFTSLKQIEFFFEIILWRDRRNCEMEIKNTYTKCNEPTRSCTELYVLLLITL